MHLEALTLQSKKIFEGLKNFPDFYLAGGTALALWIGHRLSVDFDLFSKRDIPKTLLTKIEKIFKNHQIEVLVNNPEELTVLINKIKVTFLKYPFGALNLKEFQGIKLLNINEIGTYKAYALGRCATYKDYVDLYFILKGKYATLEDITNLAKKKYQDNFDPRLFLEQLIYLEDIKEEKILFLKEKVTKEKIKDFFEKRIRKIKI